MNAEEAARAGLHRIWREAAEKGIESGIDWPMIARALFEHIDRLTGELESREHKGSMWVSKAAFDRLTEALEAAERELSSTRDALAFSNESVEAMREQAKKGVGVCWNGTCRQPAMAIINGWPLCGEHGDEHDFATRAERAEADLADEKRRHAELQAGLEALADAWEGSHAVGGNLAASLRALLDTATEETP